MYNEPITKLNGILGNEHLYMLLGGWMIYIFYIPTSSCLGWILERIQRNVELWPQTVVYYEMSFRGSTLFKFSLNFILLVFYLFYSILRIVCLSLGITKSDDVNKPGPSNK